ncbi:MAG: hypothetical protein ABR535_06175, partial [Pyrinomonadaceae bacterium]
MFDHLIGNERIKDALQHLVKTNRVPHSLLFAGPDGIGKRQFALELARWFVCQSKKDGAACGDCGACRRAGRFEIPKPDKKDDFKQIFFSQHPDVGSVVPYNRNILVDAIRELEKEANFRPYEADARIFLIDDAEKMNDAAANALL